MPRILASPMDALFTAHFVRKLVLWHTPNFNFIMFVRRALYVLMPLIRSTSECETLNMATFLLELFGDLSKMMESEKDIHPATQILQIRTELLDSAIADVLGVEPNEKAVYLKRLRLIDDIPVAITWSYMLWDYGAKLLQIPLPENFSITSYIRSEFLQEPTQGTIRLTVENIFGQDARLLDVEDGFTCCKTVSTSYIGERKFELAYDVQIIIDRDDVPQIRYTRGKVRVSDGIEHALDMLSLACDFEYDYDRQTSTVIIR